MKSSRLLKITLLLMGSFSFAFLLGEMVHEWGHFLAHRYFGVQGVTVHLDPFGGSRILGVNSLPLREMGLTTAAGPVLNLAGGLAAALLMWRVSHLAFTPLIMWGPVAMIQEGVNLSLGLLSPGSDAQWLAQWGAPNPLLIAAGAALILAGTGLIGRILDRRLGLGEWRFPARFTLLFFGLGFLIILRAAAALFQSPAAAAENLVPLAFALILALATSGLLGIWRTDRRGDHPAFQIPTWADSSLAAALGLGILLFQIIIP